MKSPSAVETLGLNVAEGASDSQMQQRLRQGEQQRKSLTSAQTSTADVAALAARLGQYEAAQTRRDLGNRERLLLQAYVHFAGLHGEPLGLPGMCWPTDAELGEYLGRAAVTARRGRKHLAEPSDGTAPSIRVRYVPPMHRLPDGAVTMHGANVIILLQVAAKERETSRAVADAHVRNLERQLEAARRRADALAGDDTADPSRTITAGRGRSTHNAPLLITPERSPSIFLPTFVGAGEGGTRGCSLH